MTTKATAKQNSQPPRPKSTLTSAETTVRKRLSPSLRYKRRNPDLYPFCIVNSGLKLSGYALGVVGLIALIAGGFIAYANYRFDNPRYASDRHYQVVYGEDSSFALPNNMIVIGASPEPPPVYTLMPVYEQMPDQRPNVQPQVQVLIVTATPEQLTFPPNWLTVTPVMHIDCTKYICTRIEYNFTPTPTNTLVDFPSMADRDAWFATFTPAPP